MLRSCPTAKDRQCPPRWIHNTSDLITWARVYDDLHAWKDAPARTLGRHPRVQRHGWYQCYGAMWTLDDPFPDCIKRETERILATEGPRVAERFQADIAHDAYDRIWATLSRTRRLDICAGYKWLIQQPALLIDKFGIDVYSGRALTEYPDGRIEWEDEPDLNLWWRTLNVYTEGRPIEDLLTGRTRRTSAGPP